MNPRLAVSADLAEGDVGEAGVGELFDRAHHGSTESPQGMASAMSSARTKLEAASKAAVPGSSELTFHPPPNHPNSSNARLYGGVPVRVVADR